MQYPAALGESGEGRDASTAEDRLAADPPSLSMTLVFFDVMVRGVALYVQLDERCSAAAFVLGGLGDGGYVGMVLEHLS